MRILYNIFIYSLILKGLCFFKRGAIFQRNTKMTKRKIEISNNSIPSIYIVCI